MTIEKVNECIHWCMTTELQQMFILAKKLMYWFSGPKVQNSEAGRYRISLQNLRSGSKINQCDCAWESIHMFFWPCPLLSPLALCTDHSPFWGVPESRCDHGPGEEEKEIRTIQPGVSWHHRSPGATTDASCCHYNHPTPNPYPLIT